MELVGRRHARTSRAAVGALTALALLLVGALSACVTGDDVPPLEKRAQALNRVIMCPVCPGESIDQSQNALAAQMRSLVVEKIAEGWTDAQIKDFFVERYGPSVILEPPRRGLSLTAWVVPPVALAAAGAALFLALRAMRRRGPVGADEAVGAVELSEGDRERYARLIGAALGEAEADAQVGDEPPKTHPGAR